MEGVWRDIATETNTKENLKITNRMAKAYILGSMVKFMRENGTITNSMDLVNINWLMEEFI